MIEYGTTEVVSPMVGIPKESHLARASSRIQPGNEHFYRLLDAARRPILSTTPGLLGGNRQSRIYGRLDCPAALRALHSGGYVAVRVFFADEATAIAAGYRPCAVCMPDAYRRWKTKSD